MSDHSSHSVGIGYIVDDLETRERKLSLKLCQVYDNAPRGYVRVYIRDAQYWRGPEILKTELVKITA